ncbi:hypothetical protein PkP19E3_21540 [Pseudomonas koreensis]|nr:hypothetical protein PkP19E3_21540 [Pseudomonas koreensis]
MAAGGQTFRYLAPVRTPSRASSLPQVCERHRTCGSEPAREEASSLYRESGQNARIPATP